VGKRGWLVATLAVTAIAVAVSLASTHVIDPSGRRRELRLPPIRKQIERTPEGLRFTGDGAPG